MWGEGRGERGEGRGGRGGGDLRLTTAQISEEKVNINNRTNLPPLLGFVWQVSGGSPHQLSWGSSQHDLVFLLCEGRGRDFTLASCSSSHYTDRYTDRNTDESFVSCQQDQDKGFTQVCSFHVLMRKDAHLCSRAGKPGNEAPCGFI